MTQRRPDRKLGPRHDDFWAWCAKGELRLQRCGECGVIAWPVVRACEACGASDLTWERMSGRGTIISSCRFHKDYYQGVLPVPYQTILVALEEGPLFISNPADPDTTGLTIGTPVSVAFIACEDEAGAFNLPVFAKG